MSVFADGFLAYHLDVYVETGHLEQVREALKGWETGVRLNRGWPGFPETLIQSLEGLDGVSRVEVEGPQSSVLIPLRMVSGMTGEPCTISAVLGTGSIADAIMEACRGWGIALQESKRLSDADSPLEFSIRDSEGRQDSVRLYPVSRKRFQSAVPTRELVSDHLLLNRLNQGLRTLAERTFENGGMVSLRIREFGRYDSVDDYLSVLRITKHLVLSTRHGVLRAVARYAGFELANQWPKDAGDLSDPTARGLSRWLLRRMPIGGIVVLHLFGANVAGFYHEDYDPIVVAPPPEAGSASRAARLQGALLGADLLRMRCHAEDEGEAAWKQHCEFVMDYAFRGTRHHPWVYPLDGVFPVATD